MFLETLEKRDRNQFVPLKLIKLDATLSTNDLAKGLLSQQYVRQDTVLWAIDQRAGRGQQGSGWFSKPGKSLTMSLIAHFQNLEARRVTAMNLAVSLAIHRVLKGHDIPGLCIKWPNDIMSEGRKLGGILIENQFRSTFIQSSVIGIGLNVNILEFPELPRATSMQLLTGKSYDIELLVKEIGHSVFQMLRSPLEFDELYNDYSKLLFMNGKRCDFRDAKGRNFCATITGVSPEGKLMVIEGSGVNREFGLKEVELLY